MLLFQPADYIYCMEEEPGSSSPDRIDGAAHYYTETLNTYDTQMPEKRAEFKDHLKKITEAIQEQTPEEQLQIYLSMIEKAVDYNNKYLTSYICSQIITLYQQQLPITEEARQVMQEIINNAAQQQFNCKGFENIKKQLLLKAHDSRKKNKKKMNSSLHDAMHQSNLIDDTTLLELLKGFIDNGAESKDLIFETLTNYSPATQFNALTSCIEMSLAEKNSSQATELYEMLEDIYTTYIAGTEQAYVYKQKFEALAKQHPELPSKKLSTGNIYFPHELTHFFDPTEYVIQEIKSPKRSAQSPRKIIKRHDFDWHNPLSIALTDAACIFHLRGPLLLAANKKGAIDCYDIKSGSWKKTLQYPGKNPLLFSPVLMEIQNKSLTSTPVDDIVSLLSSNQAAPPHCVLHKAKNDIDTSYVLQGNEDGTLILHNLTSSKKHHFDEKHADTVTAFLTFPHYAYSGSKDRSIKKWNIKERKCENSLEEMEDTVRSIVTLRSNIITLIGTKKLVHCNLSEKPATHLTLFQLSQKEKNNALETIVTFNDEYLIAGTKSGQVKIFTFGNGFANIRNIDQESIEVPVISLTNFNDEKLLVHYGNDTAMIFSKEKGS